MANVSLCVQAQARRICKVPRSCEESCVTGTPNRESAWSWQVRKGIMALECFEGWWDSRIQRGEGRALRWELHEQNSRARIHQGVWRRESRRLFWDMIELYKGGWGLEGGGNETAPREPVSPGKSFRVFEWCVAGSGD